MMAREEAPGAARVDIACGPRSRKRFLVRRRPQHAFDQLEVHRSLIFVERGYGAHHPTKSRRSTDCRLVPFQVHVNDGLGAIQGHVLSSHSWEVTWERHLQEVSKNQLIDDGFQRAHDPSRLSRACKTFASPLRALAPLLLRREDPALVEIVVEQRRRQRVASQKCRQVLRDGIDRTTRDIEAFRTQKTAAPWMMRPTGTAK